MRTTHGGQSVTFVQDLCETWIDLAFVIAFVLRDLLDHETIRLRNENDRAFRRGIVEIFASNV